MVEISQVFDHGLGDINDRDANYFGVNQNREWHLQDNGQESGNTQSSQARVMPCWKYAGATPGRRRLSVAQRCANILLLL